MADHLFQGLSTVLWASGLFAILVIVVEAGFRLGLRHAVRTGREPDQGDITLGSLLAILGLVLAFTYGGAVERANTRKRAAVDEANALSTAFLRASLLPEPSRSKLRAALVDYGETRVFRLEELKTRAGVEAALARTAVRREVLWPLVVEAIEQKGSAGPAEMSVVQAINQVLDMDTTRVSVAFDRLPGPVVVLLVFLASVSLGLAGYNSGLRQRISRWRMFVFAAVLAMLIAMFLDFDRALKGFLIVPQTAIERTVTEMRQSLP